MDRETKKGCPMGLVNNTRTTEAIKTKGVDGVENVDEKIQTDKIERDTTERQRKILREKLREKEGERGRT